MALPNNPTPLDTQKAIRALESDLAAKQDKLVSGTNIKTINGLSLLGSGNVNVEGGSGTGGGPGGGTKTVLVDEVIPSNTYLQWFSPELSDEYDYYEVEVLSNFSSGTTVSFGVDGMNQNYMFFDLGDILSSPISDWALSLLRYYSAETMIQSRIVLRPMLSVLEFTQHSMGSYSEGDLSDILYRVGTILNTALPMRIYLFGAGSSEYIPDGTHVKITGFKFAEVSAE